MTQQATVNRRFVLAKRPVGGPAHDDFRLEETPVPVPPKGRCCCAPCRCHWTRIRGRMNGTKSYAEPVAIDGVMVGATISRVEASRHPQFKAGDRVLASSGWQDYSISNGAELRLLPPELETPTYALGVLGMPGFTAYVGLLDIGQPKAGETVVVSAASGAVGSVVGQIAKLKGCRIVGIAGGPDKCRYVTEELGFDACVDHWDAELAKNLAAACPAGIDVYFENVGGAVLEAVIPSLNVGARVPLCGLIAHYNNAQQDVGHDRLPLLLTQQLFKRVKVQGFIITDHYGARHADFLRDMGGWLQQGRVKVREDVLEGLAAAPAGLMGLLQGHNFGKLVVHVAD